MVDSKLNPDKSLGQHWLFDKNILNAIADSADLAKGDEVLEIGPGLGTLTDILLERDVKLTAIEFDKEVYGELQKKYADKSIKLINQDILKFNFNLIKHPYKIVANIPYYLTSHLVRILSSIDNSPEIACLLIQKEVAERIANLPPHMSKLSVFTQNVFEPKLGIVVEPHFFIPPPKVDSQVLILTKRKTTIIPKDLTHNFERVVKAGFSEKRKKLRSSLSGGLAISKSEADLLLQKSGVDKNERAQNLSFADWQALATNYTL